MSYRHWLACIAVCLAALLAIHLYDLGERQALLRQFALDRGKGTDRIVERYGLPPEECIGEQHRKFYPLAAALLTVEQLATPRFESAARAGLAQAAAATGIGADFSIGPGRIKPSTARRLMQDHEGADVRTGDGVLTRRLLDPCGSLQVAILLLEDISGRFPEETDLVFVRRAASLYNGQSAPRTSLRADIAARIYFDLVYNIFQHYRFARRA